jgi:phage shock protein E
MKNTPIRSFLAAAIASLVPFSVCHAQTKSSASETSAPAPAADVQHVSPAEAKDLLASAKPVVLDLRTPAEFTSGHIAGAVNIDFRARDFEQNIAALDKSQPYLVHCASGGRSEKALALFQRHRFASVYHLDGGIIAWKEAGLPVK